MSKTTVGAVRPCTNRAPGRTANLRVVLAWACTFWALAGASRAEAFRDIVINAILVPNGPVHFGDTIAPCVELTNYGTQVDSFPLIFQIFRLADTTRVYADTQGVSLAVGGTAMVSFRDWVAEPSGDYRIWIRVDTTSPPDTATLNFTVLGSGQPIHDVGLRDFPLWDTVVAGDTVLLEPLAWNYGVSTEYFNVHVVYYSGDSTPTFENNLIIPGLAPGDSHRLDCGNRVFDHPGIYIALGCTTQLIGDENPANDGGRMRVVVLPSGVSDRGPLNPVLSNQHRIASVMRVAEFQSLLKRSGHFVLDATGRRIRVERVGAGIYFVVSGSAHERVVVR